MYKSGFVAIVGRPNVGKSTLLNSVLKQKVAIMSNKPQTTRNRIQGIFTDEEIQIIFIDTPGIHKPRSHLSTFMNKSAYSATRDVDLILFITNVDEKMSTGDKMIIDNLKGSDSPVYLILNKIDLISKENLYKYLNDLEKEYQDIFEEIIPISAKRQINLDNLMSAVVAKIPEGIQYYPKEMISDHPEQFLIKELIREKILMSTSEEVPHSIAVVIESVKKIRRKGLAINAVIIVERDSQKGIIIGKGGLKLKTINKLAREEIEVLLGSKVFLEIFVKVEKNWRNKERQLSEFGYKIEEY